MSPGSVVQIAGIAVVKQRLPPPTPATPRVKSTVVWCHESENETVSRSVVSDSLQPTCHRL